MDTNIDIDITALEKLPDFRSDYLYFIRQAGTYMQSIFWDVFRARTKGDRKRRSRMYALAKENISNKELLQGILNPQLRNQKTLDIFKSDFPAFLHILPADITATFKERMRQDHAIFMPLSTFARIIDTLQEKRDYLEHYDERQKKGGDRPFIERDVIKALGTFLLPHLHQMFIGRLEHYSNKLTDPYDKEAASISKTSIANIFYEQRQKRREKNERLFSEERKKEKMAKAKRQSFHKNTQPWQQYYSGYTCKTTDYRLFGFKTRLHFMGERNFHKIRRKLGDGENKNLNFKDHIEPFYEMTTKGNLILHRFYEQMPKNSQGHVKNLHEPEKSQIRTIRNGIAHNEMFWAMNDENGNPIPAGYIFTLFMNALKENENGQDAAYDLYNALRQLFEQQKFALAHFEGDENNPPTDCKIRRWSPENRQKYLETGFFKTDKRHPVLRQVAKLRKDLEKAKELSFQKKNDRKLTGASG